jgi:hypothetical protein
VIGRAPKTKRIMTMQAYKSRRVRQAVQDGNREFITLMAYISVVGKAGRPTLIYKGESRDMLDTWLEDYGDEDCANFGTSENGWSSHAYGMEWLVKVFDKQTRLIAGNRRRLLIVDGYSSYINMAFIDKCDQLGILVLILPPHSTHRLQPLDVGCFGPLAHEYGEGLHELMFKSLGHSYMNKSKFWTLFKKAWDTAFIAETIQQSWQKSGIWPFNPELVIGQITKPLPPSPVKSGPATPMTCKGLRRAGRAYMFNPSMATFNLIFKATLKLPAQVSIDEHVKKGFIEALKGEKKKRGRGKRMNLCGEEACGAMIYTPTKIAQARVYQKEKEEEERLKRVAKEEEKALNEARKQEERIQIDLRKEERARIVR